MTSLRGVARAEDASPTPCCSAHAVAVIQPVDVVLNGQLTAATVTAASASDARVLAALGGASAPAGATFVPFGDNSVLVLKHDPLAVDVYVNGALDVSVNSR